MPDDAVRLPIKVIIPQDQDMRPVPPGGSQRKVFDSVDQRVRDSLLGQVGQVRQYLQSVLKNGTELPAVARVVLKEQALAKSHRPNHLFDHNSCPVIGGETFGNLLVSVTPKGLGQLENRIGNVQTQNVTADLSTVERIEPFTADDAVGSIGVDGLSKAMNERDTDTLKLRLFRHGNSALDDRVRAAFFELAESLGLAAPEPLQYFSGVRIYRLRGVSNELIHELASFVGAQSVGVFPQFRLFAQYVPQANVTPAHLATPDTNVDYPIVGIIDSGTDPNNPLLQAWVIDRDEDDVPRADQDNNHGSFVAGLIANGRVLNHNDNRFPACQAKIVDVVGLPKPGTPVTESDLLGTIHRVIPKYPDVKVWNLSLSRTDALCRDDGFSDFGMELDAIQERFDVTFVTCAGNYDSPPLRGWPPEDLGENDRAFPPADAALGIAVGAMAHTDRADSRVRREEPSPFSRRGPGAAFLPKPEVCHYGGNCSGTLDYHQVGVVSVDGAGHVAEAIGTSFSTPLVSSLLANLRKGVVDPISRNLAKAMLVHSAALRKGPIQAEHLRYTGFGIPAEVEDILTCAPWQATLIFEPEIHPQRRIFAREEFPIPSCFRRQDDRVAGDFLMTLVYDPPLDPRAGAEYCQVNVDVSLGTYDAKHGGKPEHDGKIPLEPKDYSKLYEEHLVKHGFKWSPVKVYRKRLSATSGTNWRLQLRLLHRAGLAQLAPQNVALVVTLLDPKQQKPVYNDVVTAMNRSGWVTQDLQVQERIRARSRG